MHSRKLSSEEKAIWRKIAQSAKPLHPNPIKDEKKTKISLHAKKTENPAKTNKNITSKSTPIADAASHKKVRRGKITIEATLDLHGFNQHQAESVLGDFIEKSYSNGLRCVLIITGKGGFVEENTPFDLLKSNRGILRIRLFDWLHSPKNRHKIAGIAQANAKHGGAGAFYVMLGHKHN